MSSYNDPYSKRQRRNIRNLESENSEAENTYTRQSERTEIPTREEKLHTKTLRTFFFMHAVGQLCRVRKTKQHQYPAKDLTSPDESIADDDAPKSEIILEGIFETCDAQAGHLIILEATILKVFGPDPYNPHARTELVRRGEKVAVNMAEVKEVRFAGINITREGIVTIENEEVEEEATEEPQENKTELQDQNIQAKPEPQPDADVKEEVASKDLKPENTKKQDAPLQNNKKQQNTQDAPQQANWLDNKITEKLKNEKGSDQQKNTKMKNKKALDIDEAVIVEQSDLSAVSEKQLKTPQAQRELVRYQIDDSNQRKKKKSSAKKQEKDLECLEDTKVGHFDQFENKKSTYDFKNYTSTFDSSKITNKQKAVASQIEKELTGKQNNDDLIEVAQENQNEEELYSSVKREQNQNLNQFKLSLMQKLGGSSTGPKTNISSSAEKPLEEEKRSRLNSLHNGETTKVLQTHNIDIPIIDKEVCEQFAQFKQKNIENQQQSRKLSIEYFKEESNKIGQKLNTLSQQSSENKKQMNPKKKFTGINTKLKSDLCYTLFRHDQKMRSNIDKQTNKYDGDQTVALQSMSQELCSTSWMNFTN